MESLKWVLNLALASKALSKHLLRQTFSVSESLGGMSLTQRLLQLSVICTSISLKYNSSFCFCFITPINQQHCTHQHRMQDILELLEISPRPLSTDSQLRLSSLILQTPQTELSNIFHECLEEFANLDTLAPNYQKVLVHLLGSESLKYTLLFVNQLMASDCRQKVSLLWYCPQYLLMPNVQTHRKAVLSCFTHGVSSVGDSQTEMRVMEHAITDFLSMTIESRGHTNLQPNTIVQLMDILYEVVDNGRRLLDNHLSQCVEIIQVYKMGLDDTLLSSHYEIGTLPLMIGCYQCVTSEGKKLEDILRLVMRYSHIPLIATSLTQLNKFPITSLRLRNINLVECLSKILYIIGMTPELNDISRDLISLIVSLNMTNNLRKRVWLQITLDAENENMRAFCLGQYKQLCKGQIDQGTRVDIEMLLEGVEEVNAGNIEFLEEMVSLMSLVKKKVDVVDLVLGLKGLKPVGEIEESRLEILNYSLNMILQ